MQEEDQIVGNNIRQFRERLSMSQQELANFLAVTTPLISYYETGIRSVPMDKIDRLAALFGIDAYDLFEVNPAHHSANTAFAFRATGLTNTDLEEVAQFRKVVKNYINMKNLLQRGKTEERKDSDS